MNRRLVNLVVANHSSCAYSLHRLDVSKHLFHPSTAEAEAANARDKDKPPRREKLRRLPAPIMRFESSPTTDTKWPCKEDMFVLLQSPGGSSEAAGAGGRILHTNSGGHAALYDTGSRSVVSVSDLTQAGSAAGFRPFPFAVAGAGPGEESLYLMRSGIMSFDFEVLDFGRDSESPKWRPLPPPPKPLCNGLRLGSFTVVDGGRTICVAVEGVGTFNFDTASREWRRAGDWALPFHGRAEYVPELGTWLAFSPEYPYQLRAIDLSGVAMAQAPTLQHQRKDFDAPPKVAFVTSLLLSEQPEVVRRSTTEWSAHWLHLLNLGSGRFCIAKVFKGEEIVSISRFYGAYDDDKRTLLGKFTVLTGVEVVHAGGGLRMVKHKSKLFGSRNRDNCCIEWVWSEESSIHK